MARKLQNWYYEVVNLLLGSSVAFKPLNLGDNDLGARTVPAGTIEERAAVTNGQRTLDVAYSSDLLGKGKLLAHSQIHLVLGGPEGPLESLEFDFSTLTLNPNTKRKILLVRQ